MFGGGGELRGCPGWRWGAAYFLLSYYLRIFISLSLFCVCFCCCCCGGGVGGDGSGCGDGGGVCVGGCLFFVLLLRAVNFGTKRGGVLGCFVVVVLFACLCDSHSEFFIVVFVLVSCCRCWGGG